MPKAAKCTDPNCRTNKLIKGSELCIICKAKKLLKHCPKYKHRNYVLRGIYYDSELAIILGTNNEPYDIALSYLLCKIPRPYMRILLGIGEREDVEYELLKIKLHYDTKAVLFGKHRIMWIKINGMNYLFTPGQIAL